MNNKLDEPTKSMAQLSKRYIVLKKFGLGLAGMALASLGLAHNAVAATIPGLFDTGVDNAGAPLPDNAIDPHYMLAPGSAVTGSAIVATSSNGFPVAPSGPWLGDDTVSAWITPSASGMGPNATNGAANYWYETSFDLTGLDPATALITGFWATDNGGIDILINGVSTGQANTQQFSDFTYFQINSGFVNGTNTLTFVLNNGAGESPGDGFTGLRVEMTGTAEPTNAPPLRLSVTRLDQHHLQLSWPNRPGPVSLRETVTLPPQLGWCPVTNPIVQVGDTMTVTVDLEQGSRFFRLQPILQPRVIFPKPTDTVVDTNRTDPRQIVLKFHEGTHIRLRSGALKFDPHGLTCDERELLDRVGLTPDQVKADLVQVTQVLQQDPARSIVRLFQGTEDDQLARNKVEGETMSGEELADLDLYYRIVLPQPDTAVAESLINNLNQLQSVEIAYAQPLISVTACADLPPTTTIDLTPGQGYLMAAPFGIDAKYAWSYDGGRGAGVRVIDIENGWHLNHEDLPQRQFFQVGIFSWLDEDVEHGTAELGVLVACDNGYGATGIVSDADYGVSSLYVPDAVNNATTALRAGDVIQIVVGGWGPTGGLTCPCNCSQFGIVAMEYWQAEFDAIRTATARGIIVVEGAGNGSMSLDDPLYGGRFNRTVRDSGAILVGAGIPGSRQPECSTMFGSRVDVQGWGNSVSTLGYGDDPSWRANGADPLQFYTGTFRGISSATPIVTGAACAIQGVRRAKGMPVLSPLAMRSLLQSTGTPQPSSTSSRQIGRLPDLRQALNSFLPQTACFVSQSVPTNMVSGQTYPVSITMLNCGKSTWTAAGSHRLGSQNPQDNVTWGLGRVEVPGNVAPGQLAVFNFQVTAPAPGSYNFQWRMLQESVEWFGDFTPNLVVKVVPATNNACFASQTLPNVTHHGDHSAVTVTMKNCGNTTWTSGSNYRLGSQSPPNNTFWGLNRVELPNSVPPGATVSFNFTVTATLSSGVFYQWQMVQDGGVGFFGDPTPPTLILLTP